MTDVPQDPDDERDPGAAGGFDPSAFDLSKLFENLDMAQVLHTLGAPGPVNWQIASQLARQIATDGATEDAITDADRDQLEELAHAAQTHVVAETGFAATLATPVRAMQRQEWAALHLTALRPVLERLAESLGKVFSPDAMQGLLDEMDLDRAGIPGVEPGAAQQFAAMAPMLAPVLLGVQAGSMIGYLARHALGRYDLPLPTSDEPALAFVVPNLDEFESEWSLERADLRFYVAIHEVVHAAMRSVPWVRERLVGLASQYVAAYELDAADLDERLRDSPFADLDPDDPASLQALAAQPEQLLRALRTPRQETLLGEARVFHAVLEGYADAVLERVGRHLISSFDQVHEAMARHRIERGEAERFVEGLLGLAVGRDDFERGAEFVRGVVERAGADGLNRLWERPEMEPTPSEIVAPGLWLARIDLPPDPST
ncbi:MAG TPA: zinc-dependent metalloprotease [Acidimicrobiia bacterium]